MMKPARIQVRFADLDVMGHVNNSVYLTYFEYARVYYFNQLLGTQWDWRTSGVLLVKNVVEYNRPVLLNDTPEIYLYLAHVGTKSFEFYYELKVNDEICTTGSSVMVCFDSATQRSIEIPEQMLKALNLLDKKSV